MSKIRSKITSKCSCFNPMAALDQIDRDAKCEDRAAKGPGVKSVLKVHLGGLDGFPDGIKDGLRFCRWLRLMLILGGCSNQ